MHVMSGNAQETALFRKMIAVSVGAHVLALVVALATGWISGREPPLSERAIVTRLVKLGVSKPDLLPRIDAPPPRAEAVAISPAAPKAVSKPKSDGKEKKFDDAMKRLQDLERKDAKADDRGDARGSKQGTVSDFTLQTLGSQYAADVVALIRPLWNVPDVISEKERAHLRALVVLIIAPDGRILKTELAEKSGNRLFDASLLEALKRAGSLPAPPAELRDRFRGDGAELEFRL